MLTKERTCKKTKRAKLGIVAMCFSTILLALLFLSTVYAFTVNCTVTRVVDGDTFHCLPDRSIPTKIHKDGTITVRMRGIDAPEKSQPYGEEAKGSLKEKIGRKTVILKVVDVDRYGRAASYVWGSNQNINLEQIKRGYAWAYAEYLDRPYASEFYEAEKQARSKKLGLWNQPNPIAPWEYRSKKK